MRGKEREIRDMREKGENSIKHPYIYCEHIWLSMWDKI